MSTMSISTIKGSKRDKVIIRFLVKSVLRFELLIDCVYRELSRASIVLV